MNLKRIGYGLCAAGVLLAQTFMLPVSAEGENYTLNIVCEYEEMALPEMNWHLYLLGYTDDEGTPHLTGDFADYSVTWGDTSSEMQRTADTLENYVLLDHIPSYQDCVSTTDGEVTFNGLDRSVFLLIADRLVEGQTVYEAQPIIIELDDMNYYQGGKVFAKIAKMASYEMFEPVHLTKVWENLDPSVEIPSQIEVDVFRKKVLGSHPDADFVFYQRITLTEEGGWTWDYEDDNTYEWRFEEVNVPAGFTVVYSGEREDHYIVNTYEKEEEETTTEPTSDDDTTNFTKNPSETTTDENSSENTTDSSTDVSTTSKNNSTTTTVTTTNTTKLPQTGQLWWPVPVLFGLGAVFMIIGIKLNGSEE